MAGRGHFASRHALLLIVLGGAIIRFATLSSQGYWFDEHLGIQVMTLHPSGMLGRILQAETSPPLYFLIGGVWERVFGLGEFALRSLSALAGTATIPVVYATAKALGSRRAGLLAAALTAASPFMIWYSQEARPYALFAFFAALALLCFVRALEDRDRRWLWGWAIASIVAFSTHYFGLLPAAIEAVILLWRLRSSRAEVLLASGAVGAGVIALLPLALGQRGLASWISGLDVGRRLVALPQHFLVGLNEPWALVGPLVALATAGLAGYAIARTDSETRRRAALAGGVGLAGVAVTLLAVAVGSDYFVSRNLIGLWAPLAIGLAILLAAPPLRRVGTASVIALCIVGASLAVWDAATPLAGRPDWEGLAAGLGTAHGTRVIESASGYDTPLELYLPGSADPAPGDVLSASELDVITLRPVRNYSIGPCWWVAFCGGHELLGGRGTLPFPVPAPFKLVASGDADMYHYRRYVAPRPVTLPPATFGRMMVQPAQG